MPKLKPIIKWTPALYDRLARQYDRFARLFFPIGETGRDRVVADLDSGRILDIACGTGTLLELSHRKGLECFAVDTSRGMLEETKKKVPAVHAVQASFYALPFADDQFDYVVETNAVSGADIDAIDVLREMRRVCISGGEIRIGDYAKARRENSWFRLMEKVGILVGDYPHDYEGTLNSMGLEPQVEELGWGGQYQFIRVKVQ
jgi:ubiquinone/menaquinone biosynthesis C-methylase UbiE